MTESSRRSLSSALRGLGIRPRRRLGQNFLHDPIALDQVVAAAEILNSETVLEIGCGLGNLTRLLAQNASEVVAVEIDPLLARAAENLMREYGNVRIVEADILRISTLELGLPPGYVVTANIPYYITSSIIRHLLEAAPRPHRLILTVQREVADRICAAPPDMSLLAVSVQVYGAPKRVAEIPRDAFFPAPRVDSAVVRVDCGAAPRVAAAELDGFFRIVKAGFSQPRKKLRNSLAAGLHYEVARIEAVLNAAEIEPQRRAETLSVADWARLSRALPVS